MVLDAGLLPRRAYTVRFLGQALVGAVRGHGHRQIAASSAPRKPHGDPLAHAVEALVAATVVAHRRFGHGPREMWPRIALLTRGRLLAPSPTG